MHGINTYVNAGVDCQCHCSEGGKRVLETLSHSSFSVRIFCLHVNLNARRLAIHDRFNYFNSRSTGASAEGGGHSWRLIVHADYSTRKVRISLKLKTFNNYKKTQEKKSVDTSFIIIKRGNTFLNLLPRVRINLASLELTVQEQYGG